MPDGAILEASKTIIDASVIGAVLILSLAGWAWTVRQWMKTTRELYDEKDARLRDTKEYATLAESVRNTMATNVALIQAMLGREK